MALKSFNSVAGFSVGEVPANIILANGDITTTNITTTGVSNLNSIGNVKISGGSSGQVISTDGAGNLSFITVSTAGLSNGTSNISILNNGNITFSVGGTANVGVFSSAGLNVDGYVTVTGLLTSNNANLGNAATANFFIGSGANLTNINGANVTGTVANATYATSAGSATTAGTVTTNAQPNITSVGTLTSLGVNGTVTANTFTSNVAVGTAPFTVTSTTRVANLNVAYANVADNINVAAGTGNNFLVFANAATGNVAELTSTGLTANLSNNSITATTFVGALSGAATSATTAGTVTTNAQPNITSVGTLTSLGVNGTVTAVAFTANTGVFTGNGSGLSAIAGANVTGTVPSATAATNASALLQNTSTATTVYPTFSTSSANGNSSAVINTGISANLANASITATTFVGALSGAATTAGTVTTNAQPNITSVGTLTSLGVNGTVTAVAFTANTGVFTGNGSGLSAIAGANVTGTVANATNATAVLNNVITSGTVFPTFISSAANGNYSLTSNTAYTANIANGFLGATLLGGTLTTAAQPNITSVGTLSSLGVTGNISGANLIANTNVITDSIINKSGNLVVTANSNVIFSVTGGGTISAGNVRITNVSTPTGDADAATKAYVDNLVSTGIHYHDPVRVESPTPLNATYNNGTAGVGATLTNAGANIALAVDGISLNVADRVLIYTQANAAHNGVYVVSTVGNGSTAWVLTRSSDTDTYSPSTSSGLDEGSYFFVQEGVTGAGESYVCSTVGTITFGTTAINFVQFSKAPIYTAGTGLGLYGNNQFYISNTTVTAGSYGNGDAVATFTVNSQGQLTAAGNTAITANAANLTGTTLASGITTSSLTTVGTLGSLAVTGNATAGNFVGTFANGNSSITIPAANGNIILNAANGTAELTVTSTGANITGTLGVSGNANVGNLGTATAIITTGNITTINSGLMQNGTSNVTIASGANVSTFIGGNATAQFVVTATGVNVAGTLNSAGNANVLNLGTARVIATGNISGTQLISNIADGTAPLVVTSTTRVANLNVAYANVADNINVSTQSSGNAYLIFANALSGNVAETANAAFVANTNNGALYATTFVGNVSGNLSGTNANVVTANVSGNVILGNSTVTTSITWASLTTTSVTANQTIASFSTSGITGVEYLVKGIDATGSKYSVASVIAVTDGTNVDYSTYGTVQLGGYTGALAVNISGGQIRLQVTPASSNSTVWTTQYKLI